MWSSKAIGLAATSMIVPFLATVMEIEDVKVLVKSMISNTPIVVFLILFYSIF
jgi:hypothetical protein